MSNALIALVEGLADLTAREVAERAGTTMRTAENWKSGYCGPSWRQTVNMLNDPVLRPIVLGAVQRASEQLAEDVRRNGT